MGMEEGFFKRSEESSAERAARIFGIDLQAATELGQGLDQAGVRLANPGVAAVYASGIAEGSLVRLQEAFDPEVAPPSAA